MHSNVVIYKTADYILKSDPRDMGIQTQRIDTFIQADGICIKVQ